MKEILAGEGFDKCVEELCLDATKTYSETGENGIIEVWRIGLESLNKINNIPDSEWKEEYGWYRCADGTNLEENDPVRTFSVKGKKLKAWYSEFRLDEDIEYEMEDLEESEEQLPSRLEVAESILNGKRFNSLKDYCLREWGAGNLSNLCSITVGLAKINGMSLSQLWSEYQG